MSRKSALQIFQIQMKHPQMNDVKIVPKFNYSTTSKIWRVAYLIFFLIFSNSYLFASNIIKMKVFCTICLPRTWKRIMIFNESVYWNDKTNKSCLKCSALHISQSRIVKTHYLLFLSRLFDMKMVVGGRIKMHPHTKFWR